MDDALPPPVPVTLGSSRDPLTRDLDSLNASISDPLRDAARRAVRVWFNHGRLDEVLVDFLLSVADCELVYAIDADGRQASSNVLPGKLDTGVYGQDLSRRPFAVHFNALSNPALCGAFLCHAYTSRVTQRACITVMQSVLSGDELLGFIAADFDPERIGQRG